MPIEYCEGNLMESACEAIVNTVNCIGVMGKGIALKFKQRYPEVFRAYNSACRRGEVRVGQVHCLRASDGKLVINFPTKEHWRNSSRIEWIEEGMRDLVRAVRAHEVKSLAMPRLGCGNGGLDWDDVHPVVVEGLSPVKDDVRVTIYGERPPPGVRVKPVDFDSSGSAIVRFFGEPRNVRIHWREQYGLPQWRMVCPESAGGEGCPECARERMEPDDFLEGVTDAPDPGQAKRVALCWDLRRKRWAFLISYPGFFGEVASAARRLGFGTVLLESGGAPDAMLTRSGRRLEVEFDVTTMGSPRGRGEPPLMEDIMSYLARKSTWRTP